MPRHVICSQNKTILFYFIHFCAWCLIRKGRPVAVVSMSHGGSNLGKKLFSRGRSEIRWQKLGQKGPLGDSCLHGVTSWLDPSRQHPCIWIFGPFCTRLVICLFSSSSTRPPIVFCSFCKQSDPLKTHLVGFCMLRPHPIRSGCFPLQEHV